MAEQEIKRHRIDSIQSFIAESSSNIAQVDYDDLMNTMTIGFRNNTVYEFYGVPEEVFQNFMLAPSYGRFFQTNIRGKFDYAKRGELKLHEESD